jgi:hypothetical protein
VIRVVSRLILIALGVALLAPSALPGQVHRAGPTRKLDPCPSGLAYPNGTCVVPVAPGPPNCLLSSPRAAVDVGAAAQFAVHASAGPNGLEIVSGPDARIVKTMLFGSVIQFGDGSTQAISASGTTPLDHTYAHAGSYVVTVTCRESVTSSNGVITAAAQASGTVTVTGKPPTVKTGTASVAADTATLSGTVTPNHQATSYHFEYGTTTGYALATPVRSAGAGSTALNVSATVQDLLVGGAEAGTIYHYRLVATSAAGTSVGADRTFTVHFVLTVKRSHRIQRTQAPWIVTISTNITSTTAYDRLGRHRPILLCFWRAHKKRCVISATSGIGIDATELTYGDGKNSPTLWWALEDTPTDGINGRQQLTLEVENKVVASASYIP